ncbi:MAG: peptidoglycan-binding protein [Candidatus Kerfeldbacteria bacterium]|nr:peptidoglycan-binding protein [Candidatus Kerfeldbacteria bacterium]
MKYARYASFAIALGLVLVPLVASAQTSGGILGYLKCNQVNSASDTNPCTIDDFLNLFVYLAQWGLSIVAVLAVGTFVYGGIQFITAGGRASKVDEGKRVIAGTVVGVIISLTAYVIINFTIGAITGTSVKSLNPFAGPIATVFGGQKGLERIFSGNQDVGENRGNTCRSTNNEGWNKSCGQLQAMCADPGTADGPIVALQKQLNSMNCSCGTADGCYGDNTVGCVRRFQVANGLPPTGAIDSETSGLLGSSNVPIPCDFNLGSATAPYTATDVASNFPAATSSASVNPPQTGTGCCVVNSGENPLYCLDQQPASVCYALGSDVSFYSGVYCAGTPLSPQLCGHCTVTPDDTCDQNHQCFQQVSKYWCENIAYEETPTGTIGLSFQTGRCSGNACTNTPRLQPPQ